MANLKKFPEDCLHKNGTYGQQTTQKHNEFQVLDPVFPLEIIQIADTTDSISRFNSLPFELMLKSHIYHHKLHQSSFGSRLRHFKIGLRAVVWFKLKPEVYG